MRIIRGVQDKDRFALGQGVFTELLGLAVFFGVGNAQACGDVGVAFGCDICGGATDDGVEKGKEQEAFFGQRVLSDF